MKIKSMIKALPYMLACALFSVTLTSCGGSDDPAPPVDPNAEYVPAPGMSHAQILELLRGSVASMKGATQITTESTVVGAGSSTETIDFVNNKRLEVKTTVGGAVTSLKYFEGEDRYSYSQSANTRYKEKVSTYHWTGYSRDYFSSVGANLNQYNWTVSNGKIQGTLTVTEEGTTMTTVLTLTLYEIDKRIKASQTVEVTIAGTSATSKTTNSTITYSAAPMLPPGYPKSSFTEIPQNALYVFYPGEDVQTYYYPVSGGAVIEPNEAPAVNDRVPLFYANAALTTLVGSYWFRDEPNGVDDWSFNYTPSQSNSFVYVKWVTLAEAKNAARP